MGCKTEFGFQAAIGSDKAGRPGLPYELVMFQAAIGSDKTNCANDSFPPGTFQAAIGSDKYAEQIRTEQVLSGPTVCRSNGS